MKVLLVNDFLDEAGGTEQIVRATRELLEENGHSVLLYAPAKHGPLIDHFFSIRHYFSVLREIRMFRPDIMHVHNIYRNVSPSVLLAARRLNIPVVMTLHDFQIVCPRTSLVDEDFQTCATGFRSRCWYMSCYPIRPFNRIYQGLKAFKLLLHRTIIRRTVNHFLSPSVCLMEWAGKSLGLSNISHLPNFVICEETSSSVCPNGKRLLFVGKLTEQKGVDVLLKAVAKVRPIFPDVSLRIVGDGPEEQKLKKLAADLLISEVVTFTGKLSNIQAMKEFDEALIVIIPSKYIESFGIVGIEAMSKGKVIIASNIGGLPELVDDLETGFLVRPNDPDELSAKILHVLRSSSTLPEMGARARAKYERSFSKTAYYRTLLSVYDRIIHEAGDRNVQLR